MLGSVSLPFCWLISSKLVPTVKPDFWATAERVASKAAAAASSVKVFAAQGHPVGLAAGSMSACINLIQKGRLTRGNCESRQPLRSCPCNMVHLLIGDSAIGVTEQPIKHNWKMR